MGERIAGWRRLGYCLGMAGFQIPDTVVAAIAIYYYLPPAGRGLAPQLPARRYFEFLTVWGLAMLFGRFFNSIADPLVGFASDSSRSRFGRRRFFLMLGLLPIVVLPGLLFWPPGPPGSAVNGYSLAILLALYFISFSVYVAPYLALIPELATDAADRTRLSTLLAVVAFPIMGVYGAAWTLGIEAGAESFGWSPEHSLRVVVLISLTIAFFLCLAPVLAVDERRFTRAISSGLSFKQAIGRTLGDRAFLLYLGGLLFFTLGTALLIPAPVYYATVVLGRGEGYAAWLGLAVFATTLLGFVLMGRISNAYGAKRSIIACNLIFALCLLGLGLLRADAPNGPHDATNLRILWSIFAVIGIPIAGFLVLPYVLISQLIDADTARSGANRAATYFGLQGFFSKWVSGVGGALTAYLFQRFGNSPDQPLGVLLLGPVGGAFCLLSALLFTAYPEKQVLRAADTTGQRSDAP